MRSDLFSPSHQEAQAANPGLVLQNSKMLKISLAGEVLVRQGSMVAYQGEVKFKALGSGGIKKFLKKALTGEGIPLMKVSGQGDVFLADQAKEVHLIDLETSGGALTVNGRNVLAFEPTLSYDIRRVEGLGMLSTAGLFNCVFSGQGRIAITSNGTPVVLNVDQPTFADPQAVIAWSAALRTGFHRADQLGLGTLLGRRTGEGFTMSFAGQGFVIVQPSEELPEGTDHDDEAPVVLLDEQLSPAGELPKSQVHHYDTPLHLGFSCYVFDGSGQVLMTRRAPGKRTWPGVWSNSCCGHPLPGESSSAAAARRLREELGLRLVRSAVVLPDFRYRAVAPDGVVENEFCPVLVGVVDGPPEPDPAEVLEYRWVPWSELVDLVSIAPWTISPWAALQIPQLAGLGGPPWSLVDGVGAGG